MEWIGLVSPQGHVEHNARFVIGDTGAEMLKNGEWYTNNDLAVIAALTNKYQPYACFMKDTSGSMEKNVKKWRCEK